MAKRLLSFVFVLIMLTSQALAETLTFTFVGDCTLGSNYGWEKDPRAFHNIVDPEGFAYPFAKVQSVFAADDLTVINLEGVLTDDTSTRASGRKYNFYGKTAYTAIMTEGSVECVTLGNNHSHDFTNVGLQNTMDALDAAGIGYMLNDEIYIFEKNGIRVALIGYLQDAFYARKAKMEDIVKELKEEKGCSAVILNLHIGTEYNQKHVASQFNSAKIAINAGVDLVIEHHSHVLQGGTVYKNRNVLYSLGNFCFGGSRKIVSSQTPTVVAVVAMDFAEDGTYIGQQLTLWPARNTGTGDHNNYQPFLCEGEDAVKVLKVMQKDTDYKMNPFVEGQGAVQNYLPADPQEESRPAR